MSHTLDGRLILTDKETGRVVWERKKVDPAIGETITAAPLVIKDMAHASIHNHFNRDRHLNRRDIFKQNRSAALVAWHQLAV